MTINEVHDRAEAALLELVGEGHAAHAGIGPHGSTFTVATDAALKRFEEHGLLGDSVPWPLVLFAFDRLRTRRGARP